MGGDPAGQHASRLRGFCGVLGEVGGDCNIGDFAIVCEPDNARVDLRTPSDVPSFGLGRVGNRGEPSCCSNLTDQVCESIGCDGRVRLNRPLRMNGVKAIEPEDRVEVDQPAALVLGDLGLGEPDANAMYFGALVDAPPEGDYGAAP